MRVLVTGGCGFVGTHLTDRLLSLGHTVVVLDRFTHGKEQHRCSPIHKKNLILHCVDVTDLTDLKPSYFKHIDWFFHLVATKKDNPDPVENHRVNVDSTVYFLEAARRNKVKKFIFLGAAACYGIPDKNPVTETSPLQLNTPYALTKYAAEKYVLHWGKVYKLPVIILRLFNTYGPKIRTDGGWGPTLSIFMSQKLAGKPFSVMGTGEQLRDFTYISDVVDVLLAAVQSEVTEEIINIGSGKPTNVKMMLDYIGGEKKYLPVLPSEPEHLYPDITKARKLLGWQAKISLEEGIKLSISRTIR